MNAEQPNLLLESTSIQKNFFLENQTYDKTRQTQYPLDQ